MEFLFVLGLIGMAAGTFLLMRRQHNKDLDDWNKENKKKFETYQELKTYLREKELDQLRSEKEKIIRAKLGGWYYKEREREAAKERARFKKELEDEIKEEDERKAKERARFRKELEDKIKEEDKIKRAPKKEIDTPTEPSGGGLTSNIARLKRLYKNGTLTKAEFEKAKNNLLK